MCFANSENYKIPQGKLKDFHIKRLSAAEQGGNEINAIHQRFQINSRTMSVIECILKIIQKFVRGINQQKTEILIKGAFLVGYKNKFSSDKEKMCKEPILLV